MTEALVGPIDLSRLRRRRGRGPRAVRRPYLLAQTLDQAHLDHWAHVLHVTDLLDRARPEVEDL